MDDEELAEFDHVANGGAPPHGHEDVEWLAARCGAVVAEVKRLRPRNLDWQPVDDSEVEWVAEWGEFRLHADVTTRWRVEVHGYGDEWIMVRRGKDDMDIAKIKDAAERALRELLP